MLTLDEIRAGLADRRVEAVAAATGINRNTIAQIRDGKVADPRYSTLVALSAYLTRGK